MCATIRTGGESGQFSQPENNFGIRLGTGGVQHLSIIRTVVKNICERNGEDRYRISALIEHRDFTYSA